MPKGEPVLIAMAKGCLAFCPLMAFHSKKPSIGRMQRRLESGFSCVRLRGARQVLFDSARSHQPTVAA
jgi:hypothetical protein